MVFDAVFIGSPKLRVDSGDAKGSGRFLLLFTPSGGYPTKALKNHVIAVG
jgi:hypothetical protein